MSINQKLPPSTKRVELHTNEKVNEEIRRRTLERLNTDDKSPEQLSGRLDELNREWDTERVLEANAATVILISTILGFAFSPYWFGLVGVVSFFLLQHAVQGWCPPLPIIRRLGVGTPEEISDEKTVVKFMRGDFAQVARKPLELWEVMKSE